MQQIDDATRDAWITRTAEKLAPVLEGRVPADRVHELLERLATMEVDRPVGDMTPGTAVLQMLIEMQGFDPRAAALAARTIVAIDWAKLDLTATDMTAGLGVSKVTLWRLRQDDYEAGALPPRVTLKEGARDVPIYSLATLLYVYAWRLRNYWRTGPGARGYPARRLY